MKTVGHTFIGGSRLNKRDVPAVLETMESIEADKGRLRSRETLIEFVRRSRPKNSPTHHLFEWNRTKQAELYLLERARQIIMSVNVVFEDRPDSPVRALTIVTTGGKKGYYPTHKVFTDRDLTAQMLERAKADAALWLHHYERLRDLAILRGVFKALEKVVKKKAA